MSIKTGDRVLCIDADYTYGKTKAIDDRAFSMIQNFPELLKIYTVLKYRPCTRTLLLAEVRNPILINAQGRSLEEVHWNEWRFVKIPKTYLKRSSGLCIKEGEQMDMFNSLKNSHCSTSKI